MNKVMMALLLVIGMLTGYKTYTLRNTIDFKDLKKDANNDGMNDAVNLLFCVIITVTSIFGAILLSKQSKH